MPTNHFIALVELTSGTACDVIKAIDNALNIIVVDIEEMKNKLVNINLDGAAGNMGIYYILTKVHCKAFGWPHNFKFINYYLN